MQTITNAGVDLLKRMPESINVRKELLVALRHSFGRVEIRQCVAFPAYGPCSPASSLHTIHWESGTQSAPGQRWHIQIPRTG